MYIHSFIHRLEKISQSKWTLALWLFLVVPLSNYIVLKHIFYLPLWGDDFQAIYINKFEYGGFDLRNYFHPYGGTFLVMYPLSKLFGMESFPYYLTSFILRVMASISIYFLSLGVSRKPMAGLVASLLFSVGFVGLDSTNWTLKMNTYVGIIFLSAFVYISFQSNRTKSLRKYLGGIVFFLMAVFFATDRMHGFIALVLMEFCWLFRKLGKKSLKFHLSRVFLLGASIYFLKALGCFFTDSANIERFKNGFKIACDLYYQGNYDFFLYPFTTLGNIILPDVCNGKIWQFLNSSVYWNSFYKNATLLGIFWLIFILAFGFNLFSRRGKKICLPILIPSSIWTLTLIFISRFENTNFNMFAYLGPMLLAGFFIILSVWLFLLYRKTEEDFSDSAIFLLGCVIFFFLTPQLVSPYMSIWSCHRYLTFSFAVFTVFLGSLFSFVVSEVKNLYQGESKFFRILKFSSSGISTFILVAIVISNVTSTNFYLKKQVDARGNRPEVWNTLIKNVPEIKGLSIFYITHDNTPYDKYQGLLSFGFQIQAALTYNITEQAKWPHITDNFEQLVEILKKGEYGQYGRPPEPIGLDNVYSFDLKGDTLINTRQEVLARLKERLY